MCGQLHKQIIVGNIHVKNEAALALFDKSVITSNFRFYVFKLRAFCNSTKSVLNIEHSRLTA